MDPPATNNTARPTCAALTNPGETLHAVDQQNNSTAMVPFYDNIRYTNITATGATNNVAIIYGLDSQPANPGDPQRNIDSVFFDNVHLSGSYGADIYYVSGLDLSGLTVTPNSGSAINQYGNTIYVPEPRAVILLGVSAFIFIVGTWRRRS